MHQRKRQLELAGSQLEAIGAGRVGDRRGEIRAGGVRFDGHPWKGAACLVADGSAHGLRRRNRRRQQLEHYEAKETRPIHRSTYSTLEIWNRTCATNAGRRVVDRPARPAHRYVGGKPTGFFFLPPFFLAAFFLPAFFLPPFFAIQPPCAWGTTGTRRSFRRWEPPLRVPVPAEESALPPLEE